MYAKKLPLSSNKKAVSAYVIPYYFDQEDIPHILLPQKTVFIYSTLLALHASDPSTVSGLEKAVCDAKAKTKFFIRNKKFRIYGNNPGHHGEFGGHATPYDESPKKTALRELKEELGTVFSALSAIYKKLDDVTLDQIFLKNLLFIQENTDSETDYFYYALSLNEVATHLKEKETKFIDTFISLIIEENQRIKKILVPIEKIDLSTTFPSKAIEIYQIINIPLEKLIATLSASCHTFIYEQLNILGNWLNAMQFNLTIDIEKLAADMQTIRKRYRAEDPENYCNSLHTHIKNIQKNRLSPPMPNPLNTVSNPVSSISFFSYKEAATLILPNNSSNEELFSKKK